MRRQSRRDVKRATTSSQTLSPSLHHNLAMSHRTHLKCQHPKKWRKQPLKRHQPNLERRSHLLPRNASKPKKQLHRRKVRQNQRPSRNQSSTEKLIQPSSTMTTRKVMMMMYKSCSTIPTSSCPKVNDPKIHRRV